MEDRFEEDIFLSFIRIIKQHPHIIPLDISRIRWCEQDSNRPPQHVFLVRTWFLSGQAQPSPAVRCKKWFRTFRVLPVSSSRANCRAGRCLPPRIAKLAASYADFWSGICWLSLWLMIYRETWRFLVENMGNMVVPEVIFLVLLQSEKVSRSGLRTIRNQARLEEPCSQTISMICVYNV